VNVDVPGDSEKLQTPPGYLTFSILRGSENVSAVYNILYRYLLTVIATSACQHRSSSTRTAIS